MAARCVVEIHRRLVDWLKVGQTLAQVDTFVGEALRDLGAKSCFYGYRMRRSPSFPCQACLSVNDCVVHGTSGAYTEPMKPGDLLSVDIGVSKKGWIGDAAWTYAFKERTDEAARLMECGKESLRRGIATLLPGNRYMDWAKAVHPFVEAPVDKGGCGFHLVRGLGGHGYGRTLHAEPFVSNVIPSSAWEWPDGARMIEPGTLVAVEPMVAVGTGQSFSKPRQWPVWTADGSLSVHYEHDVLITNDGNVVLTEGLDDLPDLVG